jgi:hypothetical protein
VLVERDLDRLTVTTFTVDRGATDGEAVVTISTELQRRPGVFGSIERWVTKSFMGRLYREELANLDRITGAS